ncbi:MAG TPA: DoxX family membrane protein [Nanoarchaeota archaeon]|nr:DoxX family membrane protein [Nanoarchaeota archaeon]
MGEDKRMLRINKIPIFILRILIGIIFIIPGWQDITNPKFSADSFLTKVAYGPFQSFYAGMAGNPAVSLLVAWGLFLIGLCLLLGLLVKTASSLGIVMMLLFYLARFPPKHNLIEEHIVYAAVLFALIVFEAGKFIGIDKYLAKTKIVEKNKWFRLLL